MKVFPYCTNCETHTPHDGEVCALCKTPRKDPVISNVVSVNISKSKHCCIWSFANSEISKFEEMSTDVMIDIWKIGPDEDALHHYLLNYIREGLIVSYILRLDGEDDIDIKFQLPSTVHNVKINGIVKA